MVVVIDKYCAICGMDVKDDSFKRFGEYLCSEEHAEQYVKDVRAQRGAANASAAVSDNRQAAPEPKQPWWRRGGCCS